VVEVFLRIPDQIWRDLQAEISRQTRFSPLFFMGEGSDLVLPT